MGERSLLFPLDAVFVRAGIDIPHAVAIEAAALPAPSRTLLAHENNMTATLAAAHGVGIALRVLAKVTRGGWYLRHVLLARRDNGHPVAMGAIRFRLPALSPAVQQRLFQTEEPFGRVLADEGVAFVSRPLAFFRVVPNGEMMGLFWMAASEPLFGRRTVLLKDGRTIGHVVEILPRVVSGTTVDADAGA